jgi:hypothetical protein
MSTPEEFRKHGWIVEPELWRVGFTLNAVPLVTFLSGLVDIFDVQYDNYGNLLFYVRRTDKTNTLFVSGALRATKVERFKPPPQGLKVEALDYSYSNTVLC